MKRRFGIFRGAVANEPVGEVKKREFARKNQNEAQLRSEVRKLSEVVDVLNERLERNSRWKERLGLIIKAMQWWFGYLWLTVVWDMICALDMTYTNWMFAEYSFERVTGWIGATLQMLVALWVFRKIRNQLQDLHDRY